MAGGPERGGIQRRGWLHRRHHRRSPAPPTETAGVAGPDTGGDDGSAPDDTAEPQASLDQVLRRAAEARDGEHDPED
jgi:hypothetical protein